VNMIAKFIAPLIVGLLLSACEDYKLVPTTGTITDISFQEAHDVKKVKRSPRRIPDRWYINIRTQLGTDYVVIEHAPWEWQRVGVCVRVDAEVGEETGRLGSLHNLARCD
jgi:hypothetical protein